MYYSHLVATPLLALADAVDVARELWSNGDADALTAGELVAVNEALAHARRLLDAAQAQVAAELSRQSRPDLGSSSIAKAQGFRTPVALIAATTGATSGEAARLIKVGEAIAPRMTLTGETRPAQHPHVAAALMAGAIGTQASSAIITMLDRIAVRAGADATDRAEKMLVEQAPGLSMDQLSKVILRIEAWADPDGVAPREEELRGESSLYLREDRNGMIVVTAKLDPARGAPVKVAIEALVRAELASANAPEGPDAPRRSIPLMQADALVHLCEHALGCDQTDLPLAGATVVVRMTLADLASGGGHATIDGLAAPVSVATARHLAADAGAIPCVLGGGSEILDWGRSKRLFTRAQRLALVERDGGCAMCGAPPGHTKAHHLRWWERDAGPTDLANGVLLCESCHHRIHDNGWDIRIEGAGVDACVWFIPPVRVDRDQTPRLGGRRRFALAA
jgi:hypothetical protein